MDREVRRKVRCTLLTFAVAVVTPVGVVGCNGVDRGIAERAYAVTGGDPEIGRAYVQEFGCASCHTIPGVRAPSGDVGPPLAGIGKRAYIAGVLANTPENMVRWLVDPPAVDPATAMPSVGLAPDGARHVAAYLYTLVDG